MIPVSRPNLVVAAVAVAAAAVGIGAAGSAASAPNLREAVLARADLPAGFSVKQTGFVSMPQARLAYVTVFVKAHPSAIDLLRVDSNAALYVSPAAAKGAVGRLAAQIRGSRYQVAELDIGGRLGTGPAHLLRVRYYDHNRTHVEVQTIVWQEGSREGVVDALGLAGTVDQTQVVALARKQDRRLVRA